jgi:hypothetical protein
MRTLNILKKKTLRARTPADSAICHAMRLDPGESIAQIDGAIDVLVKAMRQKRKRSYCVAAVSRRHSNPCGGCEYSRLTTFSSSSFVAPLLGGGLANRGGDLQPHYKVCNRFTVVVL